MGDDRWNSAEEAADTERGRGEVEGLEKVAGSGNDIDDDDNRYPGKQVTRDDAVGGADSYCAGALLDGEASGAMGRGSICLQSRSKANATWRDANAPIMTGLGKTSRLGVFGNELGRGMGGGFDSCCDDEGRMGCGFDFCSHDGGRMGGGFDFLQ